MSAPALLAAAPLLAGVVAGALGHTPPRAALIVLSLAWIAAAASLARRRGHLVIVASACGCFAAGAVIGTRAADRAMRPPLLAWFQQRAPDGPLRITGVLRADATVSAGGISATIDVSQVSRGDRSIPSRGGIRVSVGGSLAAAGAREWTQGRRVTLAATLREPTDYRDPGVASDRARLARQEVALLGSVKSAALVSVEAPGTRLQEMAAVLRAHVREATQRAVGRWHPRAAGVATAILIGDRSGLDPDDERRLQEAGTYHVIAISGGNIALLTALLVLAGRWMRVPPRPTAATAIALLTFYGYAAGLAPSVFRATLAGIIFLSARVLDQRGPALNTLALVSAIAAVSAPLSLLDPGFVLSYAATLAIVAVTGRFLAPRERAAAWPRWRRAVHLLVRALRGLGIATICAEIALAPVGARLFGRISLAGLILNFAAIPLMSVIQIAALAAVLTDGIAAPAATAFGWIVHVATDALIRSAALVDVVPWLVLDLPPPSTGLMAGWYAGWAIVVRAPGVAPRWRRRLTAAAAVVIVGSALLIVIAPPALRTARVPAPPPGWTRIVFLDVGQGDATILLPPAPDEVFPLLVDAGGTAGSTFDVGRRVTLPALWALGVSRLEAIVVTHGDPDHIGGAPAILRALDPRVVLEGVPVRSHQPLLHLRQVADAQHTAWREVRAGETLASRLADIRVVHPPEPDWERRKVRNDDSVVLDIRIGDVEIVLPGDVGRDVEAAIAPHVGRAPVVIVKAPHAGARVFRTDQDGAVFLDTDGHHVRLWTWVRGSGAPFTVDANGRPQKNTEEHEATAGKGHSTTQTKSGELANEWR